MDKIVTNKYGKIRLSESILGQVARKAIHASNGQAWLSNNQGKIINNNLRLLVSLQTQAQSIDYEIVDGKVIFTLHIICAFGKSLSEITSAIIKQLEIDIPKVFPIPLAEIRIIVKGIKSKEIAKRNIVFVEKYDN